MVATAEGAAARAIRCSGNFHGPHRQVSLHALEVWKPSMHLNSSSTIAALCLSVARLCMAAI